MKSGSIHKNKTLEIFSFEITHKKQISFVDDGVKAGFPSPASDFPMQKIDLNEELVRDPETTFLARVNGDSMKDLRIFDGDLIIVDKALEPQNGNIAVCFIDGDFTLKRLKIVKEKGLIREIILLPENKEYKPIYVTPENDFIIWGILTYNIIKFI
ncbi:translesion error-prone DNA polymerase V autoproteolytic subunit [Apibacter raozihei]|uniref:LexA family protein n=1 Tax=Apibacter TaxID=1778601 RepID=UPI000FE2C3BB|nr:MULTISPECIES: translesion error-prone DNA polymerase V autoproteolytic subunit [Apibacter]